MLHSSSQEPSLTFSEQMSTILMELQEKKTKLKQFNISMLLIMLSNYYKTTYAVGHSVEGGSQSLPSNRHNALLHF